MNIPCVSAEQRARHRSLEVDGVVYFSKIQDAVDVHDVCTGCIANQPANQFDQLKMKVCASIILAMSSRYHRGCGGTAWTVESSIEDKS